MWLLLRADSCKPFRKAFDRELAQRLAAAEILEQVDAQLSDRDRVGKLVRNEVGRPGGEKTGPRERRPSPERRGGIEPRIGAV